MPLLIVIALSVLLIQQSSLTSNMHDPLDSTALPYYRAKIFANNIFYYSSLLYNYGRINSDSINNAILVNPSTLVLLSNNQQITPAADYQLLLLRYNDDLYLMNSWTIKDNNTASSKSKNTVSDNDVLGELTLMLDRRLYNAPDTFWQLPIIGTNHGCNSSDFLLKSHVNTTNYVAVANLFTNLCQLAYTQLGVHIKPFVLFEEVSSSD